MQQQQQQLQESKAAHTYSTEQTCWARSHTKQREALQAYKRREEKEEEEEDGEEAEEEEEEIARKQQRVSASTLKIPGCVLLSLSLSRLCARSAKIKIGFAAAAAAVAATIRFLSRKNG